LTASELQEHWLALSGGQVIVNSLMVGPVTVLLIPFGHRKNANLSWLTKGVMGEQPRWGHRITSQWILTGVFSAIMVPILLFFGI
jgi:hypothetical protein